MISITAIKNKLESNFTLTCEVFELAADVEVVMKNQTKSDYSIHVLPGNESGVRRSSTEVTTANVEAEIGVLIGLRDVSNGIGSDGQDPLKLYREEVARILQGFMPDGSNVPLSFTNGSLLKYENGMFWQLDSYAAAFNLRGIHNA